MIAIRVVQILAISVIGLSQEYLLLEVLFFLTDSLFETAGQSKNKIHRFIEQFELEGAFVGHLVQLALQ